jgi:hypothetical protein
MANFNDPVAAVLALQRALESRRESDWMGGGTAGMGAYPPINIFQRGDDFVAVIELPGISQSDLQIEAKGSNIRISGKKTIGPAQMPACIGASGCRVYSTVQYRCRSRLIPMPSRQNITTAYWRCPFLVPRAKSPAPSRLADRIGEKAMADQEVQVQQKREREKQQESTYPTRVFLPVTSSPSRGGSISPNMRASAALYRI